MLFRSVSQSRYEVPLGPKWLILSFQEKPLSFSWIVTVPQTDTGGQGESAPKARLRSVADGKQVNIPVPLSNAMGGRRKVGQPGVGCPGLSV